jgi:hypothetical protein
MMSTTHAAMGALLAAPVLWNAPELAPAAALAGYAGGLFPDIDVVAVHRRTLHFPDYYWLLAAPAVVLVVLRPAPATVAGAAFLLSAALHSVTDVFGGGPGLEPWSDDDDRGVYLHSRGRWLRARGTVRYDGAPEDLALAAALTVPGLTAFGGTVRWVLLAGLAASALYTVFRKRLVAFERVLRR